MAVSYHHRFISKIRSLFSIVHKTYDPFGDKIIENFRSNPYYPFTHTQSFTFEYQYRRWSTIYLLIIIQILIFALGLYSYYSFHIDDYWISGSEFLLLFTFGLLTIFVCVNLIENLKQRRIVLSPLDFHVSIYINNTLKQQCSLDRVYICLHQIESYNILLYHLVFIIEDIDFIKITDYFHYKFQLRQIGKCLAQNLYISYLESQNWIGIFPKYKKLKNYIHKQQQTVNPYHNIDDIINVENNNYNRKRKIQQHTIIDL
ncbi:unnamed protein product [Rotaria socialis]|uniref:Uncharacterized protein n=2 Tax=Rotaria socialis TaxID=392032 RepID=A0A820T4J8_9BILA|nr:unnamed protein product [Rotaria socialis]CAF3452319.1 unnamed protein product [Rotaria socialis]CAF3734012.1 unnamed protein product [Rotaria socialis]CAF3775253.1 unnamed protein product [Rotaria socialis]CAF4287574.1 unnamed protein product [Rotaria socialis]